MSWTDVSPAIVEWIEDVTGFLVADEEELEILSEDEVYALGAEGITIVWSNINLPNTTWSS